MYTHGLVVIISTKRRRGGFARTVGMTCITTPHGLGYAKIAIVVDETVDPDMEEAVGSFHNVAPKGLARQCAGNAREALCHARIAGFRRAVSRHQASSIKLHIGEDDRQVDLVREGIDCVPRAGTLQDSSMVGRRDASMAQVIVANPAYLAQFGEPTTPQALEGHRAVN
jgi:DNA-binding transcriptional LysR family regulator